MIAIEFKIIRTEDYLKGTKQKYPSKVFSFKNRKLNSRQIGQFKMIFKMIKPII